MRKRMWIALAILVVLAGVRTVAQNGANGSAAAGGSAATDVKNAEIQKAAQSDSSAALTDRALRVVSIEGNYNVGVGVVHRNKTSGPDSTSAIEHSEITEVYHIISGSGTLLTGGSIEDAKPAKPESVKVVGPSMAGDKPRGGVSREVGPGDVVIIPPNTAHWFTHVSSEMVYLVVRMDPKKLVQTK